MKRVLALGCIAISNLAAPWLGWVLTILLVAEMVVADRLAEFRWFTVHE